MKIFAVDGLGVRADDNGQASRGRFAPNAAMIVGAALISRLSLSVVANL